jgi:hypothetical protein
MSGNIVSPGRRQLIVKIQSIAFCLKQRLTSFGPNYVHKGLENVNNIKWERLE